MGTTIPEKSGVMRPFVWSSCKCRMPLQVCRQALFYLMRILYHYHQLFIDIKIYNNLYPFIVFVWSQYDGGNIEQRLCNSSTKILQGRKWLYLSGLNMMEGMLNKEQVAKVPSKTKKGKLKIMGGDIILVLPTRSSWSNHSQYNICKCAIIFSVLLTSQYSQVVY